MYNSERSGAQPRFFSRGCSEVSIVTLYMRQYSLQIQAALSQQSKNRVKIKQTSCFEDPVLIILFMQSKQMKANLNQPLAEHPEESLRVISNYSSLERLLRKSKQAKNYPHLVIPKSDSFNIAAWQYSALEDRQTKVTPNKSKFNSAVLPFNHLALAQTILSQKKGSARSRFSPANQRIIQTTNFKCRRIKHKIESIKHRALSLDTQNKFKFQDSYLKYKKEMQTFYQNQVLKRKEIRGTQRQNPCFCLPLSQYPVMKGVKGQKGQRRLRKEQFLQKHQM